MADKVAALLQLQREGRDGLVPPRALEDSAEPRLPEVLAAHERAAAGRAARRGDLFHTRTFQILYHKMSGKGASASEAHRSFAIRRAEEVAPAASHLSPAGVRRYHWSLRSHYCAGRAFQRLDHDTP